MKSKCIRRALLISICLLTWLPTNASAGNSVKWYKYGEGMALGKKNKKPLFVHFRADWCFFCRVMIRKTLQDPAVVTYLNENFIAVIVDVDKEPETTSMYGVRGIPDTWLLTQKGNRIRNIRGYIEPDALLSVLKEVRRQIK